MLHIWPSLQPVAEWVERDGAWAGLSGMLAAVAIGAGPWLCAWMSKRRSGIADAYAALGELVLVGVFLGDRAVVAIGVVSMAAFFVMQLATRAAFLGPTPHPGPLPRRGERELRLETPHVVRRCGWAGCLAAVTLVWLLVDPGVLPECPAWLQHFGSRLLAAAALMTVSAAVLTVVACRRPLFAQR
jgi:hypothetical protein